MRRRRRPVAIDGDVEDIADVSSTGTFQSIVDQGTLANPAFTDQQNWTIVLTQRIDQLRQRLTTETEREREEIKPTVERREKIQPSCTECE